jgi:hypothetical protein
MIDMTEASVIEPTWPSSKITLSASYSTSSSASATFCRSYVASADNNSTW